MKPFSKFFRAILPFLMCTLFANSLIGQSSERINWKNFSDSTFVFEINNKEAEKFLKQGGSSKLMDELLHTHTASFVNKWDNAPQQGHFIYANIHENKVDYRYAPIMPFQVFIFHEYGLLTLQVIDANGEIRSDAKVKIQRGKWRIFDNSITYDQESKTYTIDDWSDSYQRILTVELDKFRAVFDLNKHIVRSSYGSNYRWVLKFDFSGFAEQKNPILAQCVPMIVKISEYIARFRYISFFL